MSGDAPGAELSFRRAGPGDLDAVVELTRRAYGPYTRAFGAPPIPVTEDYAPRIAAGEVWLLESGPALAGLAVLEEAEDHLMIFSLAIAPAFQGKGLGLRLLEFADERARSGGYSEVRLYTNALMERNIALYARYGYRETGRRANPKRPGWTVVDMARALD